MEASLLIVDDEEIALRNLQHVMEKEGYQVTATQSGATAASLLESQRFDVVLTDLKLPAGSGFDVLHEALEADPETFGIFDMKGLWFVRGDMLRDFAALTQSVGNLGALLSDGADRTSVRDALSLCQRRLTHIAETAGVRLDE